MSRPTSPSAQSDTSTAASTESSRSSLIYSRDELLAIGTSPLSHHVMPAFESFPNIIMRRHAGRRRPASPEAVTTTPPVLKVGVYIPPARRVAPEHHQQQQQSPRHVPGRVLRPSRAWRRPSQARPIVI